MKIDILTIFPEAIRPYTESSMLKKARDQGLAEINVLDLRDWALDKHKTVDDKPFGGGPGMVIKLGPVYRALESRLSCPPEQRQKKAPKARVLLTSVRGEKFTQNKAAALTSYKHIIIIAGRYEGVDERVRRYLVDKALCIGDYVLTGGELPALVITDALVRLVPGVLGEPESLKKELSRQAEAAAVSYPVYTRPEEFTTPSGQVWKVPKVLVSGNHKEIERWRKQNLTTIN